MLGDQLRLDKAHALLWQTPHSHPGKAQVDSLPAADLGSIFRTTF